VKQESNHVSISPTGRIILLLLTFLSYSFSTEAKTIKVGVGHKYKTIKSALNNAVNGDTISVSKGFYNEGTILINKSIVLLGEEIPVISGDNKNEIIKIKSDNVIVRGFQLRDAGLNFIYENAAIKLDSVKNCVIEKNIFINNFFGIYLSKSSLCKLLENEIEAFQTKETYSGNGIHLWQCREMLINGNRINGHRDGIYFEFVKASVIENNKSRNNIRYGLHFMFSDSCSYSNNYFTGNGAGVAVMFTKNVLMFNNIFENNWGGAAYGLLLKDISDSRIFKNRFIKNSSAVYYEGCSRVKTEQNDFIENGWAIRLMANSMENSFTKNNFIGNTFDVATNSTRNYNLFNKNYWAEYNGYDLDKDGIGDVPYRPVKYFSFISEKVRPSLILVRSLFIELINLAENIFPTITPEALIDGQPSMKRIL
jgi:nitrous oxidase accessory protein